jgi:hypothetical protein
MWSQHNAMCQLCSGLLIDDLQTMINAVSSLICANNTACFMPAGLTLGSRNIAATMSMTRQGPTYTRFWSASYNSYIAQHMAGNAVGVMDQIGAKSVTNHGHCLNDCWYHIHRHVSRDCDLELFFSALSPANKQLDE